MEKVDIKRLREEAVAQARHEFKAARTTRDKHYARLVLARAIRARGNQEP